VLEHWVLPEYRRVHALQLGARFDAEFIMQGGPRALVDLERLGLAPGPVQGQHELGMQALPVWVIREQRAEVAGDLRVAAEGEVG